MAMGVKRYFDHLSDTNELRKLSEPDKHRLVAFLVMYGAPGFDIAYQPLEQLSSIASKAQRLAGEIRSALSEGPVAQVFGQLLNTFVNLPRSLEAFSSAAENLVANFSGKPGHKARIGRNQFLVVASEFVRRKLGQHLDGDLAELAQAVNPGTEDSPIDISSEAIRKSRQYLERNYPIIYQSLVRQVDRGLRECPSDEKEANG